MADTPLKRNYKLLCISTDNTNLRTNKVYFVENYRETTSMVKLKNYPQHIFHISKFKRFYIQPGQKWLRTSGSYRFDPVRGRVYTVEKVINEEKNVVKLTGISPNQNLTYGWALHTDTNNFIKSGSNELVDFIFKFSESEEFTLSNVDKDVLNNIKKLVQNIKQLKITLNKISDNPTIYPQEYELTPHKFKISDMVILEIQKEQQKLSDIVYDLFKDI